MLIMEAIKLSLHVYMPYAADRGSMPDRCDTRATYIECKAALSDCHIHMVCFFLILW